MIVGNESYNKIIIIIIYIRHMCWNFTHYNPPDIILIQVLPICKNANLNIGDITGKKRKRDMRNPHIQGFEESWVYMLQ